MTETKSNDQSLDDLLAQLPTLRKKIDGYALSFTEQIKAGRMALQIIDLLLAERTTTRASEAALLPIPVSAPEPDYDAHVREQEQAEARRLNAADETLSPCELCGGTVVAGTCDTCGSSYENGKRILDKYDVPLTRPMVTVAQALVEVIERGSSPAYVWHGLVVVGIERIDHNHYALRFESTDAVIVVTTDTLLLVNDANDGSA